MPFTGSVMKKQCGTSMINWRCSVKVGDLVRRIDLPDPDTHWLRPHIGVITVELKEFRGESFDHRLFKVFWGAAYGTFVMPEHKLELLSENR
jgi:hypothetical protein